MASFASKKYGSKYRRYWVKDHKNTTSTCNSLAGAQCNILLDTLSSTTLCPSVWDIKRCQHGKKYRYDWVNDKKYVARYTVSLREEHETNVTQISFKIK